jgi:hypothetical protein
MADQIQVQITADLANLVSGLSEAVSALTNAANEMKASFEELKSSSEASSNAIVDNLKGIQESANSATERSSIWSKLSV